MADETQNTNTNTNDNTQQGASKGKLNEWAKLLAQYIHDKPGPAAIAGLAGMANFGGLTDNSEFLGQAIGGIGGGLVGPALGMASPNAALIGGALGSFYDKLQAKKKEEEKMQQMMYMNRGGY